MDGDIYSLTFPKEEDLIIKIIRILHSSICWTTMMVIVIIGCIVAPICVFFAKDKKKPYHVGAIIWSRILLYLAGIKVEVEGLENIPSIRPLIFMPNHQGHWDYPVLIAHLPLRFGFVIKKELFNVPFFGTYIKKSGYFSLDREAKKSGYNTLIDVTSNIKLGESIVIFPEGTRTYNGSLGEFKRGSFILAFKTGVPIIPIAISGSFEIMPRGTFLINPRAIRVSIGKQVTFNEFKEINKQNYKKAIEKVRNTIISMLLELEEKHV